MSDITPPIVKSKVVKENNLTYRSNLNYDVNIGMPLINIKAGSVFTLTENEYGQLMKEDYFTNLVNHGHIQQC